MNKFFAGFITVSYLITVILGTQGVYYIIPIFTIIAFVLYLAVWDSMFPKPNHKKGLERFLVFLFSYSFLYMIGFFLSLLFS